MNDFFEVDLNEINRDEALLSINLTLLNHNK